MNPEILGQAQSIAAQVMANVSADQLENSTPCAKWNVGQLIDHLVGSQHWARAGVDGSEMQSGDGASQGDYNAAFAEAADAAKAAFAEEGAMERTVNPGFGDMPAAALLGLAVTDTFTHAWDLATATGQDNNLAPEMAQQLLAASQQSIQPAFRSEEGDIFGLEQQAPEGANAASQLAAFLGRRV
ncbi:MAG: TIGR03086 family protein [Acidimicrobiales bacterium]|nr:TIGR03086 family protein [Acidimicrobiales bacterium]